MNQDSYYMDLAIAEAEKSTEPLRCGAVIVSSEGKVLASTYNSAWRTHDASAHAEINAIRIAGKELSHKELTGCTIYSTCEPCVMCLSALVFAKIKRIVFGLSLQSVTPDSKMIRIPLNTLLKVSPYKPDIQGNFMEEECQKLIR